MTPEQHHKQSQDTLAAVKRMEDALAAGELDMTPYFHEDFIWRGNQGCGTKKSLQEFRDGWQKPLRAAFTDRKYMTEQFMADGAWASCFGYIDGLHTGEFMGIAATNKRVRIPYMDFWLVEDGRIKDNPVNVDFASVLAQLGRDVFAGEGWEAYDRGEKQPPHSDAI